MAMKYGLTLERDKAFESICNWQPLADGDTIKPTDAYQGTDGQTVYVQLAIMPGEFVQEVTLSGFGGDVTLEGYGFRGDVAVRSSWDTTDITSAPLIAVLSVVADGSVLSDDLTFTIVDYTSFIDNDDNVITDDFGDAINVVA